MAPQQQTKKNDHNIFSNFMLSSHTQTYQNIRESFVDTEIQKIGHMINDGKKLSVCDCVENNGEADQRRDHVLRLLDLVYQLADNSGEFNLRTEDLQHLYGILCDRTAKNTTWRMSNSFNHLEDLMNALKLLHPILQKANYKYSHTSEVKSLIVSLFVASLLLYGISELQPFFETKCNEFVSHLCVTWAFRKYFPTFPYPVFCTGTANNSSNHTYHILDAQAQTELLNKASRQIKENISRLQRTNHSKCSLQKLLDAFLPIVQYLLNYVYLQTGKFRKNVVDRSKTVQGLAAEQVLRQNRMDSQREGSCIICLGENPNMTALCCGAAMHLNCLVEWLRRGHGNCVSCRTKIPLLTENGKKEVLSHSTIRDGSFLPLVRAGEDYSFENLPEYMRFTILNRFLGGRDSANIEQSSSDDDDEDDEELVDDEDASNDDTYTINFDSTHISRSNISDSSSSTDQDSDMSSFDSPSLLAVSSEDKSEENSTESDSVSVRFVLTDEGLMEVLSSSSSDETNEVSPQQPVVARTRTQIACVNRQQCSNVHCKNMAARNCVHSCCKVCCRATSCPRHTMR